MLQVLQVQKAEVSTHRVRAPGPGGLQRCPLSQGHRPAPVSLGSAGAVPVGWGIPRASPAWPHRKLLLAWELPTPGCSGLCRFCRRRIDRTCNSCWAAAPWEWPLTEPLRSPWAGHWTCHSPSFSSSLSSSSSALDPPLFSSFSSCGRSPRGFLEKQKHLMSQYSAGAEGEEGGGRSSPYLGGRGPVCGSVCACACSSS